MQGFNIHISAKNTATSIFFKKDYDSFTLKNDDLEITIEGIILNKKQLLQTSGQSDFTPLFLSLYQNKKIRSIQEFDGEFRGYIWDKTENKIFVFTNPTSTQRVFYTKQNGQIFIDSHLVRLNHSLKKNQIKTRPDVNNLYQLLTFGNMLENETPIAEVYKILDGHYIEIDLKHLSVKEETYFGLENVDYYKSSKAHALKDLDSLFSENILWEYEKDDELASRHFSFLSGGLDSRMAVLYAEKLGQKPDEVFCFSQSEYLDHTISEKIARDYNIPYRFQSLDGGHYLKYIDELTTLSEGCGLFTGGVHIYYALENLKNKDFKLIHSGSIGDGILGGFNTASYRKKPGEFKIVVNQKFLPKVKTDFEKILENYQSEELFYLRNVAYNRTVLGAQVIQQYAYQTSPFMSKKMLEFAISLPEDWKINQKFYLEWLNLFMPNAAQYQWEKTGMKPNAVWKNTIGTKVKKRISKIWNTKITNNINKTSMYPYEFYYYNSTEIQNYYTDYFQSNLWRLDHYPELKQDVEEVFAETGFYQKTQAVNILAIFKLFFT